jgi:dCMP deaminase
MKARWIIHWLRHAELISEMSPCPRGKVGAFVIDERNNPLSAGFNGPPRGACGELCGGEVCTRSERAIASGTSTEVGCHHAEQNALMNALHKGVSVAGCVLVVTTPPCLGCARLIHHAGIAEVIIGGITYSSEGAEYLRARGVAVSAPSIIELRSAVATDHLDRSVEH